VRKVTLPQIVLKSTQLRVQAFVLIALHLIPLFASFYSNLILKHLIAIQYKMAKTRMLHKLRGG